MAKQAGQPHQGKRSQDLQSLFYLKDAQGKIMALVDTQDNVVKDNQYSAFGEDLSGKDAVNPFRFIGGLGGRKDDDTGLVYFWSRWYDPSVGRWVTEDPIRQAGGLNVYAYLGNHPLLGTDLTGLCDVDGYNGAVEQAVGPGITYAEQQAIALYGDLAYVYGIIFSGAGAVEGVGAIATASTGTDYTIAVAQTVGSSYGAVQNAVNLVGVDTNPVADTTFGVVGLSGDIGSAVTNQETQTVADDAGPIGLDLLGIIQSVGTILASQ
jgi:RHS repeat-associated protein